MGEVSIAKLRKALRESNNSGVRYFAARALCEIKGAQARDALEEALESKGDETVLSTIRGCLRDKSRDE
jgi:HEAT repeat protein